MKSYVKTVYVILKWLIVKNLEIKNIPGQICNISSTESPSQTCFNYICMINLHLQVSKRCKYQTNPFVTLVSVRECWRITFVSLSITIELSSAQFPLAIVRLVLGLKPPALPPIWKITFQLRCLRTPCHFLLLCNTPYVLCCFCRHLHSTNSIRHERKDRHFSRMTGGGQWFTTTSALSINRYSFYCSGLSLSF